MKVVIVDRNQTTRKKRCHNCGELLKAGEKVFINPSNRSGTVYHHPRCMVRYQEVNEEVFKICEVCKEICVMIEENFGHVVDQQELTELIELSPLKK